MKHILLYQKINSSRAVEVLENLMAYFDTKGIAYTCVDNNETYDKEFDLMIVLGGDGTLLSSTRFLYASCRNKKSMPPVLGVNTGSLGFLTECRAEELIGVLEKGLKHGFKTEHRTLFDVVIGDEKAPYPFLNDLVIRRKNAARIMDFDIWYNGEFVSAVKADGVIISSPTGSTAYSLAAGGPILHPEISSYVINPISPHTLTNRPLVVSDKGETEIVINSEPEDILVTTDGQVVLDYTQTQSVKIRLNPKRLNMIRPYNTSYFDVLRNKLSFGMRG
jgi:NAD+ kinase